LALFFLIWAVAYKGYIYPNIGLLRHCRH